MAENYGEYRSRKQDEKEAKDEARDSLATGFRMKGLAWRCSLQDRLALHALPGVVVIRRTTFRA
jgi:hypothetical protein